jgi:hypothetical protein
MVTFIPPRRAIHSGRLGGHHIILPGCRLGDGRPSWAPSMIFVVKQWTPMSHYSRVLKVVIDAPPGLHDQELAFWQGALGQELPEIYSAEYHGAFLRGNDLMLLMQRLESTWTFIPTIWTPKWPGSNDWARSACRRCNPGG